MNHVLKNITTTDFSHDIDFLSHEDYSIHCHNLYEVYYFISGDVSYLVEGKHYTPTPHSILMISPNILHGVKSNSSCAYNRYVLHFPAQLIPAENRATLLSPFHQSSSQSDIYYQDVKDFKLQNFFENLLMCKHMPEDMRNMTIAIAVQSLLTQILYMSKQKKSLAPRDDISKSITNIIAYINTHLTEKITLDNLSSKFFISKHHLNKVFRKATGTTVLQYINLKKTTLANHYMMEGKSATESSLKAGFNDYSVFYRSYKKTFGYAPTHHPKLNKKK